MKYRDVLTVLCLNGVIQIEMSQHNFTTIGYAKKLHLAAKVMAKVLEESEDEDGYQAETAVAFYGSRIGTALFTSKGSDWLFKTARSSLEFARDLRKLSESETETPVQQTLIEEVDEDSTPVEKLDLPANVVELLIKAGFPTVEKVEEAGKSLTEVNGIGDGLLKKIEEAVASLREPVAA